MGEARAGPLEEPGASAAASVGSDASPVHFREQLVALVAARLPGRAAALLGFLAEPGSAEVAARAALLASASREERLRALAAALAAPPGEVRKARARAVAQAERAAVAGAALAVARLSTGGPRVAPLLERLLRELLES